MYSRLTINGGGLFLSLDASHDLRRSSDSSDRVLLPPLTSPTLQALRSFLTISIWSACVASLERRESWLGLNWLTLTVWIFYIWSQRYIAFTFSPLSERSRQRRRHAWSLLRVRTGEPSIPTSTKGHRTAIRPCATHDSEGGDRRYVDLADGFFLKNEIPGIGTHALWQVGGRPGEKKAKNLLVREEKDWIGSVWLGFCTTSSLPRQYAATSLSLTSTLSSFPINQEALHLTWGGSTSQGLCQATCPPFADRLIWTPHYFEVGSPPSQSW